MRHAREGVTLLDAYGIGYVFIPAGKRYRLEGNRLNIVNVLCRELNDLTDAVVVDAVDDRYHQRDFDADARQILNCADLYVEQVADAAMLVLLFANAVELQIDTVLAGGLRGFAKLKVFGETNSVGRGEDAIETNLLCVGDRLEIVRRER